MKLASIVSDDFTEAFRKITLSKELNLRTMLAVKKLSDFLFNERQQYDTVRLDALKKFAFYDLEKNEFITEGNSGLAKFVSPEAQNTFVKQVQECLDKEITLPFTLSSEDLAEIKGLTLKDLNALDGVIV